MGMCRILISVLGPNLVQKFHTLCIQLQFLLVHMCFNSVEVEGCLFKAGRELWVFVFSNPFVSYTIAFASSTGFCEPWREGMDGDLSFSGVLIFLILCILSGCERLYLFFPTFQGEIFSFDDLTRLWFIIIYSIIKSHVGALLFLFFISTLWYYPRSLS